MKERLNMVLEEYGLNSSRLAEKMGIQRSGISHIMAGRNKPSYDFIVSLLKLFPELDANWLLTGEGSMFKGDNTDNTEDSTVSSANQQPDLFSNLSQERKGPGEDSPVAESIQEEKKISSEDKDSSVYKNKQSDYGNDEVESVLILLNNGKFKTYRPE